MTATLQPVHEDDHALVAVDAGTTDTRVDAHASPSGAPAGEARPVVALAPARRIAATTFATLGLCAVLLVLHALVISRVEHRTAQTRAFDTLRFQLAQGTAPLGQTDEDGHAVAVGSPVALLEIPSISVKEVVREGTSSAVLAGGPGHQRNTPLPGQPGVVVVAGRAHAYAGPFGDIGSLRPGAIIKVTTGQGLSTYIVTDKRKAGQPAPAALAAGSGRLVLMTATGLPYLPSGVLRVDADLKSPVLDSAGLQRASLPRAELPLQGDTSSLASLVLWLQAMVIVVVLGVWAWLRWGRVQAWCVLAPLGLLVGIHVADNLLRLMPNMT